jgi:hypothetical protein
VPIPPQQTQEAEWDTEYINNLPDGAFAVIASSGEKDEQGKTVPRTLRKLPHHNIQGNLDLPHLRAALARMNQIEGASQADAKKHLCGHARGEKAEDLVSEFCGEEPETATEQQGDQEPEKDEHGCIIGKERWDPDQEICVAIATEQQGDQEPERDEHGCIIGKERYDEEQDKCVPITTEQQGDQEHEKDEHGCIIGKERYDEEQDKCVPIEATEGKKKGLGEAIIDPGAASEPSDLISRKEVLALIPDRRVWRSWSYGPQMLVRQLKRKLEG